MTVNAVTSTYRHRTVPRQALFLAVLAVAALPLSSCASDPTAISCDEFVALPQSEQLDVMKAWAKDHGTELKGSLGDFSVRTDLQAMVNYCSDSQHRGDKLSRLQYSF
jgi:hypothetical protein